MYAIIVFRFLFFFLSINQSVFSIFWCPSHYVIAIFVVLVFCHLVFGIVVYNLCLSFVHRWLINVLLHVLHYTYFWYIMCSLLHYMYFSKRLKGLINDSFEIDTFKRKKSTLSEVMAVIYLTIIIMSYPNLISYFTQ